LNVTPHRRCPRLLEENRHCTQILPKLVKQNSSSKRWQTKQSINREPTPNGTIT